MSETIRSLLTSAKAMLLDCVEQPEFEAQLLLAFVLSESREHLLAWPEKSCDEKVRLSFFELLDARVQGKPIAYILGEKSFWDINLTVNSDVLIPRPETEMLVELVLECVSQNSKSEIAELGTGSGAIVCALAHHLPKASFVATDLSHAALRVAAKNADRLALKNVTFFEGSWCDALPTRLFDIIISNPPYIALSDSHLTHGDLRFEPQSALSSGEDGLDAIREIVRTAGAFLKPGGVLFLEHGYDQADPIRQLCVDHGFASVICFQDMAGHDRITQASFA